ncbi:MAG: ATPase P [Acidobacteria bacterium]|nr:ATPase P [Acidobacteriota bacterium]
MTLSVTIPGRAALELDHLLLDFTGTLSLDGALLPGVAERLESLARTLRVTVLTADTFGTARQALAGLPLEVRLVATGADKLAFLEALGASRVVAAGNGRNDAAMLERAALGIAVVGPEGAAAGLVGVADVVVTDIRAALDLVLHPLRLTATLRV